MPMRRDLPFHRSGMQVRRPPIRRATPRLRSTQIFALVFMFLCLLTVISLGGSQSFGAKHLEVHGARFTGEQTVSRIVGMSGSPNLFRLRTDRIAATLAELPAVESVRIDLQLPDTVVVTVIERQPRLIWVIGQRRYVVDDTGLLFGEVDAAGNPIETQPVTPTPSRSAAPAPGESGSGAPASGDSAGPDATDAGSSDAGPTIPLDGRVAPAATSGTAAMAAKAAKATPKPTPKPTAKPKVTPKATPKASPTATPTAAASPTSGFASAPSLLPVPTADPAAAPGARAVNLPLVYDRRTLDSGLTIGAVIDPIALDAGYRLAGLTPAQVGSNAPRLDVVLDDQFGFTLSSGAVGWVAQFGFYTETLRKDTVIPMQVRDLRELLLNYGEKHVAWVWLVADISDSRLNTYLTR
jgi:hypothetical protein